MLPEVSRDDVLKAFDEFDRALRTNENWTNWEDKETQKYAIEHDGRLYPPKMILSLASGVPVGSFSGGLQGANRVLASRGFNVVSLAERRNAREAFRVWWVNQGSSYDKESDGGFIWAPKTNKAGVALAQYTRLQELREGDVLIHYADKAVRAISRVASPV